MNTHSGALAQALLDVLPFGVDIVDEHGTILFMSERQKQLLGAGAHGRKCWEVYRDDRTQCPHCPLRNGVHEAETATIVSEGVLGGRTFEIHHTGLVYEGKRAVLEIFQDVTDQRERESALRLTQFALDRAADAVYWITSDARFYYVNEAACDALGYSRDELLAMTVYDINPTLSAERWSAIWGDLRRHGVFHTETVHQAKDGRTIPVEIAAGHLTYRGREYSVAFTRNITERKAAEQALRRSEAEYRELVQHAPLGIYRSSVDGRFLSVNPALVEMLGYESAEDLMRVDLVRDVYVDPADRPRLIERYSDRDTLAVLEDVRWKRRDGRPLTVRLTGRVVRDEDRTIRCFEVIAEDVTERRVLEEQLRQAQKMEAIGQLTAGITHDFNNALSVILLNAQLALATVETGGTVERDDLEHIEAAATSAATLTNRLLGFSRRADLTPVPTDLARVVSDVSTMLRRLIPENIEVAIAVAEPVAAVEVDLGAVEQMLVNLATNARDAMPEGGTLRIGVAETVWDRDYVSAHPWTRPGRYVCLSVSDTGTGMDEATRRRVFEPFFTTKSPGKGTGLGLSMVYGLTKQQQGFVDLTSEPGRGTDVRLFFPVVAERAQPLPERISREHVRGGKETILLVEDEEPLRTSVRRALERHGYTVLTAEDGVQAIERFHAHHGAIDLVVSDLVMPRMGGRELYESLRTPAGGPKFLLVSGHSGGSHGEQKTRDPTIPFLHKPWELQEFLVTVRRVLDA